MLRLKEGWFLCWKKEDRLDGFEIGKTRSPLVAFIFCAEKRRQEVQRKVEILTLAFNVKGKSTCCLVWLSFHCPLSLSLSVLSHRVVLRLGRSDAHCTT